MAAVAADALALPEAGDVAVIGSGLQAWAQLWALSAVRRLRSVRVFSPSGEHRDLFAQRARRELGLAERAVRAVDTPSAAVQGADVVLLATRSTTPVLDADDIAPGAHVSTVGPKARGAQEVPPRLLDRASLISCDSPQQAAAYDRPFVVEPAALTSLVHVLTGRAPGRTRADEITVHCSVGMAGSEVVVAHRLLELSARPLTG
ncbi:hypothetical protein [Terrabacter sp. NPDC000476]|uniref:hypothetical protein n=1 Tax=Terrabacter sp. NPDC000476 TaxID=3154258 RepID=UPI003327520B